MLLDQDIVEEWAASCRHQRGRMVDLKWADVELKTWTELVKYSSTPLP